MTMLAAVKREERRIKKTTRQATTSVERCPFRGEGIGWFSQSRGNGRQKARVKSRWKSEDRSRCQEEVGKGASKGETGCRLAANLTPTAQPIGASRLRLRYERRKALEKTERNINF
jgi:hypothetical protein